MSLNEKVEELGKKLAASMSSTKNYDDAWATFARELLSFLTENTTVVGLAPSGGGPITGGKIQ